MTIEDVAVPELRIPFSDFSNNTLGTTVSAGLLTPTSVVLPSDSLSSTGMSILGASIDVKQLFTTAEWPSVTIKSVRAMALRVLDFRTRPEPSAARGTAVPAGGAIYKFTPIREALPGPNNKVVVWVNFVNGTDPLDTKVAEFLIFALIKEPQTSSVAISKQRILDSLRVGGIKLHFGTMVMGGFTLARINGQPTITDPPDGGIAGLTNVHVDPIVQTPFFKIPLVVGEVAGATIVAVWGVVLRADAIIPDSPFGPLAPVEGRRGPTNGTFLIDNVPGAVLGLDNKLVVWLRVANVFGPYLRAIRLFNGTA